MRTPTSWATLHTARAKEPLVTKRNLYCPFCGASLGHCPQCETYYIHGTTAHCPNPPCARMNAPVDCACGRVVSADLKGILDCDMNLHPFVGPQEVRS